MSSYIIIEYPTQGQKWLKESRAGQLKFLVRGTKKVRVMKCGPFCIKVKHAILAICFPVIPRKTDFGAFFCFFLTADLS